MTGHFFYSAKMKRAYAAAPSLNFLLDEEEERKKKKQKKTKK